MNYYLVFEFDDHSTRVKTWRIFNTIEYDLDCGDDLFDFIREMQKQYDNFILLSWKKVK